MTLQYKDREVEAELDRNQDGSRYIGAAYYTDGAMEDLNSDELDDLQNEVYDIINGMWG
jgi:hypothetical protein